MDTKSKTHEANPQKGFVVQINASENFGLAIATAALNLFAPAVGHAQDYIVNGHNASKAEAQFLASYSAPAGNWQVDGYGFSRVADEHPAPAVVKTAGRKCWYVLDVQLCD